MDWDKLRLFYEVAKAGSITAAAESLNISQSALSRSIHVLEYRLKTQLFERLPKGIKLTKQGEVWFKHTGNMLSEFLAAKKCMNNSGLEEVNGSIKIQTNHSLAYSWLIHYVGEFMEKFPKVKLAVNCQNQEDYDNHMDIYIGPYLSHRTELIQNYIKTFYVKLFASKNYLEKFGTPQKPEDLDNHRLITRSFELYPKGDIFSNWMLQVGKKEGHTRIPYFQINSSHALLNAARNGLGIVTLGKDYPKLEKINDLVEVLPDLEGPKIDIYYTYPLQMKNIASVISFHDYLEDKVLKEDSKIGFLNSINN